VIEVRQVAGRSVATRIAAQSPLRLLQPRGCPGDAAWIYTSTFGGGLVGGDQIDLSLHAQAGSSALLATQASTKVFRSLTGKPARQTLRIDADAHSSVVLLPDPLTCFAGSVFEQRMSIELHPSASLVLLDWITSGRRARGERWAFGRYLSQIDISIDPRRILRDSILLDPADGPLDAVHRMGSCDCMAVIVLLGPELAVASNELLAWAHREPIRSDSGLVFSAGPLANGAIVRVAGLSTESTDRWIRKRLRFLPQLIGGDPWKRKS
jgi:urease accessory protein